MESHRPKLVRFDLFLPPAAVEVIKENAAIRGISPRTMGRVLVVEKIKDLIGLDEAQHKKNWRTKLLARFWGMVTRTARVALLWVLRELIDWL
jgi:hypothetical protein